MTEIKTTNPGTVSISDDTISVIAGTAAMEAAGVAGLGGAVARNAAEARKQTQKGVQIAVDGDTVKINISLTLKFGVKVQEVCRDAQQKIKAAVENMTGLTVSEVNVSLSAVAGEKQRYA